MTRFSRTTSVVRMLLVALPPLLPLSEAQAQDFDILEATIDGIHAAFAAGELTCTELVRGYRERIESYDRQGPAIHAVQTLNPRALAEAERLDAAFASSGLVGPLHCVPMLVKDQVEVAGMPTTYGSALFQDFIPERDGTVVTKMKEAGAIILGKATMGEFANGHAGSAFGICRNVYALDRNPSGSSCGSGIGMAANFATIAIGEDTGGSVRGPAAHTNTVGLRPTLPLISRFGMFLGNPTRDTLGPMTRTVRDAAILTDVLAGYDPNDPVTAYSVGHIPETYTAFLEENALEGARLGVIRTPMDSETEPESEDYSRVKEVIDRAIDDMASLGAEIIDPVEIPELIELLDQGGSNHETEAAINAYLDQHPDSPVTSLREIAVSDLVTPRRLYSHLGALNRSTDDLEYMRAMAAREELRQLLLHIMAENELDAFVYATFDHSPALIPHDIMTNLDAEDEYSKGSNRSLSPAVGFPALSVPAGFTSEGLPSGIEFLGRPFTEGILFGFAYAYEQRTMHRRPPDLTPVLRRIR